MQALTNKIFATITAARVPSIKFLGPRHLLPPPSAHSPVSPGPATIPVKNNLPPLKSAPAVKNTGIWFAPLEDWQIEMINSGGVIEPIVKK